MFYNLFPKFKIVEINNVAALRMGHVIAQTPADLGTTSDFSDAGITLTSVGTGADAVQVVENGLIVGYGENGKLQNYNPENHTQPCLVYTEELITSDLLAGLDQFADPVVDGAVYPRALPLNLGDTFTTNNFEGTLGDGFGKVNAKGRIEIQEGRTGAMFIVKKSNLPAGQDAIECTYIGLVKATA